MAKNSGIYYFLGNTTSHILHALPLYRELGGTFVVLSKKAKRSLQAYNVPVLQINDVPYQWQRYGYKIKPIHEYDTINKKHAKTVEFLNTHAKVVLFYDLFDFSRGVRLAKPTTIFLTHGNMLKDYMSSANRTHKLRQYDFMAALGPYLKEKFVTQNHIPVEKLIDLGIARTDEVITYKGKIHIADPLRNLLPARLQSNTIVSYVPTFWGASSIYTTGLTILRHLPPHYTLLFRPHPQTPKKLLKKYEHILSSHTNIIYLPEGRHPNVTMVDIFNASSAIIGDVSSVMLEAILTEKPLIFAYDTAAHRQASSEYKSIEHIVAFSDSIDPAMTKNLETILDTSIQNGINHDIWKKAIDVNFFHAHGDSVHSIVTFVKRFL